MNGAPNNVLEALHAFAESLRARGRHASASIVETDLRALVGAVERELSEGARGDGLIRAIARAWGRRNDAAILAAYRALHESGGDEGVALAVLEATPAGPPTVAALVRDELARHTRRMLDGGKCIARTLDVARTPEDWAEVADSLRVASVCPDDIERLASMVVAAWAMVRGDEATASRHCAALAGVSTEDWLSATRAMFAAAAAARSNAS